MPEVVTEVIKNSTPNTTTEPNGEIDLDKLVAESEQEEYQRVKKFAEELDSAIVALEKKYDLTLKKNKIRVKSGTNKWEIQLRKFVTSAYSIMEIEHLDKSNKHREMIETKKDEKK